MTADVGVLSEEERALVQASRSARGQAEAPLPRVEPAELRRLLRVRVGLGGPSVGKTVRYLAFVTGEPLAPASATGRAAGVYAGPRVALGGTLTDLRASWREVHDDMLARGTSGAAVRNYRLALLRYCRALEVGWEPEASPREKRSMTARARRSEEVELPEDFIPRVASIVNDLKYVGDEAANEAFRHRARLNFFTAPRCPSEDARLGVEDVRWASNAVVYRQSKVGDGDEVVLVPRVAFGLHPTVLSNPKRRSLGNYVEKWRPRLVAALPSGVEDSGAMWPSSMGTPMDADYFRRVFGATMKEAWPGAYPYLVREVGIIMRAVEMIAETGHLDLEVLVQWTGQAGLDTLRRYTRKARGLLRDMSASRADAREFIGEWRRI